MSDKERLLYVSVTGQSDVGLVRSNNEDSFLIADLTEGVELTTPSALNHAVDQRGCLFAVADGMGGAAAGEVASRTAVESVSRLLKASKYDSRQAFVMALKNSIDDANTLIRRESHRDESSKGMGTTFSAAGVYDGAVFFAQVGDSRAYLVRNNVIVQMTKDQSWVAHLVATGVLSPEKAKNHPQRNIILQALGSQDRVDVAFSFAELRKGDWLILCSDGLSGKIEETELSGVLEKCSGSKDACERMITIARSRGGEDNITVIVARFDGDRLPLALPEELPVYQEFEKAHAR